jgi:AbrB family looped-hinge helix DNA binding protein
MRTTIDKAGRIVVPKALRDAMGLEAGHEIELTFTDGRIEIDVPAIDVRLERRDGLLVAVPTQPVPVLTAEMVRAVIEELRDERASRLM